MITLSWQTVITIASILTAIGVILKYYNKGYDFVKRQNEQDATIADIQKEQSVLTVGILACLKGLKEQGCDGPVTDAISQIEVYLNEKAHRPAK